MTGVLYTVEDGGMGREVLKGNEVFYVIGICIYMIIYTSLCNICIYTHIISRILT